MSGGLLELRQLRKNFGGVVATNDVSLRFEPGTLSAIIGPNGAGKTTLFHLITGKLPVSGGEVLLDGAAITGLDRTEIVRRGIGRAFQVANLFPSFVVRDALAAALMAHAGRTASLARSFPPRDVAERADEVMELCGLAPWPAPNRATFPMATRNCSTSPWPWRSTPRCCCWTSPLPAWGPMSAGG